MSLRARLQASIVALVAVVVLLLSALYLALVVDDSFRQARMLAEINAKQIVGFINARAPLELAKRDPAPMGFQGVSDAYADIVERDLELPDQLLQLMSSSPVIVESFVTGPDDRILAASRPNKKGQKAATLPHYDEFEQTGLLAKLGRVFSSNRDYEVVQDLGFEGRKVLTIHMVLSTVLLRQAIGPRVSSIGYVLLLAMLASVAAAALVSRVAVQPLARIGDLIDSIASGETAGALAAAGREGSEVAVVESKLNLLGEQFRGAQADARELRSNIDQLLTRLEEAVFLFGRDDRLVMAGGSAERLLGAGRWEMMGRTLEEVFPIETELGATLQGLIDLRHNAKDHPTELHVEGREPLRLLTSVETVEEFPSRERVGTLVTLREAEPRRQIESQIDVSTRLAAISRLTSGAAHEIKNPLNSIALHVEVLKGKLEDADMSLDEISVISREITRLDRVVRSFLDFTRPVELEMHPFDLAGLVDELAALVRPDAQSQNATVAIEAAPRSAPVRGDRDLLKQAVLNVMINGLQAMPEGGALTLALTRSGRDWLLSIRDEGAGIPDHVREKIFQLYFTTKGKGSGIGLAMTFRVVQLHGGTIDFVSEEGQGAEFRLQIPALDALPEPASDAPTAERAD
ncbi:MAG: hypothetical protein H6509_09325 [Bryobacterales bacterium]|nr:hypothetical protein [Bryobacterales bacterium]